MIQCLALATSFVFVDSQLAESMKSRFARKLAILLGNKKCVSPKDCVWPLTPLDLTPPRSMSTSSKFPCAAGINKNMLIWYSWSYDELWKVMMMHKKSSVRLQGDLKDALGYTSLRDCSDSGVPKSSKFKDPKNIHHYHWMLGSFEYRCSKIHTL